MTRTLLTATTYRTTTALTLSLSLLQPTTVVGQTSATPENPMEGFREICAATPEAEGCSEYFLQVELCTEDPDIEGCDVILEELAQDVPGTPGAPPPQPDIPTETPPEITPDPDPQPEEPVPGVPDQPDIPEPPTPQPEIPTPGQQPEVQQAPQGASDSDGAEVEGETEPTDAGGSASEEPEAASEDAVEVEAQEDTPADESALEEGTDEASDEVVDEAAAAQPAEAEELQTPEEPAEGGAGGDASADESAPADEAEEGALAEIGAIEEAEAEDEVNDEANAAGRSESEEPEVTSEGAIEVEAREDAPADEDAPIEAVDDDAVAETEATTDEAPDARPEVEAPEAAAPDAAAQDDPVSEDDGQEAEQVGEAEAEGQEAEISAEDATRAEAVEDDAEGQDEAATEATSADAEEAQADGQEAAAEPNDAPEGTEAPTVSDEEAVEAEAEPTREPTAEEAAMIERMMQDPEVAGALQTLNRALGVEEPTEEAAEDGVVEARDSLTAGAAALAAALAARDQIPDEAAPEPENVTEVELTDENSRTSGEDFDTPIVTQDSPEAERRETRRGLSRLEQAGLLALGAVGVGMLVGNNRVVANSGDRVVVDRGDGDLAVWKDDDALIRQPGNTERTERYADGSTRTTLTRNDGSSIITVRDATGRVLWRERREPDGETIQLIDDLRSVPPVDVSTLPEPRLGSLRVNERTDTEMLRALLAEAEAQDMNRSFSLRQVRETRELRELAPEISAAPITFPTGSAMVPREEAGKLVQMGRLMQEMISENPREIFLIEGHTDAVGSASYNLALSDRRAESVALALSEYFNVPPENMVVQGYGERFLQVPTQEAEPANRRVAVRRITWLLH